MFTQVAPCASGSLSEDANMKRRSALFTMGIVGFILICAGGIIASYYALERSGILSALLHIREARIRVLCKTDYRALLGACRELSDRASRGELKHKKYFVYPPPDPEVSTFPQAILDLAPGTVTIDVTGRVMIAVGELWGQLLIYVM